MAVRGFSFAVVPPMATPFPHAQCRLPGIRARWRMVLGRAGSLSLCYARPRLIVIVTLLVCQRLSARGAACARLTSLLEAAPESDDVRGR